jgi:ketosteroid isomerase-like protein
VPPPRDETPVIRRTLAQWRAAYENLSVEQLASVWLNLGGSQAETFRKAFEACRSYTVTLQDEAVQVAADGQTATVAARVSYEGMTRVGNRRSATTSNLLFRMRRVGADWKIAGLDQR